MPDRLTAMVLSAYRRRRVERYAGSFDESKHPRGHEGNAGEFASTSADPNSADRWEPRKLTEHANRMTERAERTGLAKDHDIASKAHYRAYRYGDEPGGQSESSHFAQYEYHAARADDARDAHEEESEQQRLARLTKTADWLSNRANRTNTPEHHRAAADANLLAAEEHEASEHGNGEQAAKHRQMWEHHADTTDRLNDEPLANSGGGTLGAVLAGSPIAGQCGLFGADEHPVIRAVNSERGAGEAATAQTPQDRMKAALESIDLPHQDIKVYGSQITVETSSRDTAEKWGVILQKFGKLKGIIETTADAKINRGTILLPSKIKVFRVYAQTTQFLGPTDRLRERFSAAYGHAVERYRQASPSNKTPDGGKWCGNFHINHDGLVDKGCAGVKGEHISQIGRGEKPTHRQVRDHRQDLAEHHGFTGRDLSSRQVQQLEELPHPKTGLNARGDKPRPQPTLDTPVTVALNNVPHEVARASGQWFWRRDKTAGWTHASQGTAEAIEKALQTHDLRARTEEPEDVKAGREHVRKQLARQYAAEMRKALRQQRLQTLVDTARDYGVSPDEVNQAIEHLLGEKIKEHALREKSKRDLRRDSGLTAGDLARIENAHMDLATAKHKIGGETGGKISRLNDMASSWAQEYPALELGNADAGDDVTANVWDRLREGVQAAPRRDDPKLVELAAQLAAQYKTHSPAESAPLEEVPFSRFSVARVQKYSRWLQGRQWLAERFSRDYAERYSQWDERKHHRGQPGNAGEFAKTGSFHGNAPPSPIGNAESDEGGARPSSRVREATPLRAAREAKRKQADADFAASAETITDSNRWGTPLATLPIDSSRSLNGGINETSVVHLRGDGNGVYKPASGETNHPPYPQKTAWKREVAACVIDRALGFGCVPETIGRDGEHGPGSVQQWVDGTILMKTDAATRASILPVDIERLAVLDLITRNSDRHAGNLIVHQDDEGNMRLALIDNGYSCLPSEATKAYRLKDPFAMMQAVDAGEAGTPFHGVHFSGMADKLRNWLSDETSEAVENFQDRKPEIAEQLKDLLEPAEIEAIFDRARAVLKNKRRFRDHWRDNT